MQAHIADLQIEQEVVQSRRQEAHTEQPEKAGTTVAAPWLSPMVMVEVAEPDEEDADRRGRT
jgi:hypothetical protein